MPITGSSSSSASVDELRRAGLEHLSLDQNSKAQDLFEVLLKRDKRDFVSWAGLGTALEKLGDNRSAEQAYRQALDIEPSFFPALHHLGRLTLKNNDPRRASKYLSKALEVNPSSEAAHCDLGSAFIALDDFQGAEVCFRRAIALNPGFLHALACLAGCLREQFKFQDSVSTLDRALTISPTNANISATLASTLSDLGNTDKALHVIDEALAAQASHVECHQNRALILLRAERLQQGFAEYEWRRYPSSIGVSARPFSMPTWQGESLDGRTLLIWLEQGIGDEIMTLGVWDTLLNSANAKQYMVECDPRLTPLLRRSFPSATIVSRQDPPSKETGKAHLSSAGWSGARFLRDTLSKFPKRARYLHADEARTASIRAKYAELANGRKIVGLSWGSGARKGRLKTPPLETWQPLVADASLFIVSLQYEPSESDLAALSEAAGQAIYVDPSIDATSDLDGWAAQISALDAVVTISNSTAHLSGALGVPVAALIPSGYGGFWYWFRDRTDSPWYPSMKICRQSEPGEWHSAIQGARTWLNDTDYDNALLP